MSSGITKRVYQFQVPLFLVSLFAGIVIAEHYLDVQALTAVKDEALQWGVIVTAFTTLFAYLILIVSNARRVGRTAIPARDRMRALILLVVTVIFCIAALMDPVKLTGGAAFNLLYSNTIPIANLGMIIGMHLVFTWAAIKKLQTIPDIETLIMLVFFTLEIFAEAMTVMPAVYPPIGDVGVWIKTVPNMVGQRAAIAAAGIGAIILGLRALVWKEPGLIELEISPEEK
jgi:cytochrome bd-type quinol oxidase subunit 2